MNKMPPQLPQFNTIDFESFPQKLESLLNENLQKIENLLKNAGPFTWDNLLFPLETLEDNLERIWAPIGHLRAVMDSKTIRECYQKCLPLLSAYGAKIGQNQALYQAIKSIDNKDLKPVQTKILQDAAQDFELSGVALSPEKKKLFETIQTRLTELSNKFENNVLDAENAFSLHITDEEKLKGLPDHALHTAKSLAKEKGLEGWILNLEYPCYIAVATYAENRELRETMYHAYTTRASEEGPHAGKFDNTALMDEILSLRHEKAQLLGFNNYAELSLATKMADSADQVLQFLSDLSLKAYHQAKQEFNVLSEFATQYALNDLKPWDLAFISEKMRLARYDLSQEALRPYFPIYKVSQGLFEIVEKLYGMKIEIAENVEIWHPDVQCYCIKDKDDNIRGYIYADLFARPHKRGGAWMDVLQSRWVKEDGTLQLPIATLTCNFAKASDGKPAKLSHEEVQTYFHEFGHCLQHVLTKVDYLSASGISGVEWDAVELPSQFFENWCWDNEALKLLTSHAETGENLSLDLFEKLLAAKNFHSALGLMRQLEFALFDFYMHLEFEKDIPDYVKKKLSAVREKTAIIPTASYNRFQNSFTHVFGGGYAAGYYSYLWAEVLSSDAFSRFEEEGIFNRIVGEDFLRTILETGSSKPASQAYIDFRGAPATIDAMLRHKGINLSK